MYRYLLIGCLAFCLGRPAFADSTVPALPAATTLSGATAYIANGGADDNSAGFDTSVFGLAAGNITLNAGGVTNGMLANSSLTIAGHSVSLGGTQAISCGDLSDATAACSTALGTGVATALGVNIGTAGAFVVNGGALGTPSSGVLTHATGLPLSTGVTGTLAAGQFPALTGDLTTSAGSLATTLATVNSNVGGFGNATSCTTFTVNGKGLLTAAGAVTCTPGIGSVTGLGTGVATALGVNIGTAGAFVVNGGALGTPSSGTLTNATGLSLTSGVTGILPVANGGTGVTSLPGLATGRLTLSSGVPVMTTTVSAATSVLWTPFRGSLVWFYDGTRWYPKVCAQTSNVLANSSTGNAGPAATVANSNYDLFMWDNGGTCTLTRAGVWSSNTARSNALAIQDGIYMNGSSITNGPAASRGVYVGSVHTDAGAGTVSYTFGGTGSGGVAASFGVWNNYNRVLTQTKISDNGTAYTYSSMTTRQARGSTTNQGSFILGLQEDGVSAAYLATTQTVAAIFATTLWSIALDGSPQSFTRGESNAAVADGFAAPSASLVQPGIGFHTLSMVEQSDGTNANTFDVGSANNMQIAIWN